MYFGAEYAFTSSAFTALSAVFPYIVLPTGAAKFPVEVVDDIEMPTTIGTTFCGCSFGGSSFGGGGVSCFGSSIGFTTATFTGGGLTFFGGGGGGSSFFGSSTFGGGGF